MSNLVKGFENQDVPSSASPTSNSSRRYNTRTARSKERGLSTSGPLTVGMMQERNVASNNNNNISDNPIAILEAGKGDGDKDAATPLGPARVGRPPGRRNNTVDRRNNTVDSPAFHTRHVQTPTGTKNQVQNKPRSAAGPFSTLGMRTSAQRFLTAPFTSSLPASPVVSGRYPKREEGYLRGSVSDTWHGANTKEKTRQMTPPFDHHVSWADARCRQTADDCMTTSSATSQTPWQVQVEPLPDYNREVNLLSSASMAVQTDDQMDIRSIVQDELTEPVDQPDHWTDWLTWKALSVLCAYVGLREMYDAYWGHGIFAELTGIQMPWF